MPGRDATPGLRPIRSRAVDDAQRPGVVAQTSPALDKRLPRFECPTRIAGFESEKKRPRRGGRLNRVEAVCAAKPMPTPIGF